MRWSARSPTTNEMKWNEMWLIFHQRDVKWSSWNASFSWNFMRFHEEKKGPPMKWKPWNTFFIYLRKDLFFPPFFFHGTLSLFLPHHWGPFNAIQVNPSGSIGDLEQRSSARHGARAQFEFSPNMESASSRRVRSWATTTGLFSVTKSTAAHRGFEQPRCIAVRDVYSMPICYACECI
jgi:hypothetical protein